MMNKQIDANLRISIESFVEYFRKNRHDELNHILDNIKELDFFDRGLLFEDKMSDIVSESIPHIAESRKLKSRILKRVAKPLESTPEERLEKLTKAIQEYAIAAENAVVFHDLLLEYFSRSDMNQRELASMAQVNYNTLNSILNNHSDKKISRDYILKLCIAMKLSMDETDKLLCSAGYILIGIDDREMQIRAAIANGMDLIGTNILLDENGLKLL